jgi:fused signal recognition particle receptor
MISSFFGGKKSAPEENISPAEPDTKTGFFGRMREAITRTRENLADKVEGVLALTRRVDEETLSSLETALLTSDLGVTATTAILDHLRERALREEIPGHELRSALKAELKAILDAPATPIQEVPSPRVVLLVGVNGTGKTTTSGKLAAFYRAQGKSVLLCAADTFRAAAIEQLEVWSQRSGVALIKSKQGSDPAAVLFDSLAAAKARGIDVLLVDTAGRLHTKGGLMDELDKMRRITAKQIPGAPHEVLLVMDATTGQNGLQQARLFAEAAGVTGIVLTKLDGTAKGGIAIAIAREMALPVRYAGVGEKMEDLLPFDSEVFVESLLG